MGWWTDRMQIGGTIGARIPAFWSKTGVEPGQQNKKMLKSRGESQDVVENKGPKKLGCTKTRDVVENKQVTRLTRDVDENKGLNTKSGVNCAQECTQKRTK